MCYCPLLVCSFLSDVVLASLVRSAGRVFLRSEIAECVFFLCLVAGGESVSGSVCTLVCFF